MRDASRFGIAVVQDSANPHKRGLSGVLLRRPPRATQSSGLQRMNQEISAPEGSSHPFAPQPSELDSGSARPGVSGRAERQDRGVPSRAVERQVRIQSGLARRVAFGPDQRQERTFRRSSSRWTAASMKPVASVRIRVFLPRNGGRVPPVKIENPERSPASLRTTRGFTLPR